MIFLKEDTASQIVRVGPFVDATNGVTPETGITLGAADQAEVLKVTGTTVDISARTWAAITGADGWYNLTLADTDVSDCGALTIIVQDESVCLPVFVHCVVLQANVYDSLIGGTTYLETNPGKFSTSGATLSLKNRAGTEDSTRTIASATADPITGLS